MGPIRLTRVTLVFLGVFSSQSQPLSTLLLFEDRNFYFLLRDTVLYHRRSSTSDLLTKRDLVGLPYADLCNFGSFSVNFTDRRSLNFIII